MAERDGAKTHHHGQADVYQSASNCPASEKIKRLQTKGRECGEPAAKTDHDKQTRVFRQGEPAMSEGECADKADDERANNVDEDSSPGQAFTDRKRQRGKIKPGERTDCPARCH